MKKLSFSERCYEILRSVPRGKLTTYRDIAEALGTRAYRAVGNCMHQNPNAPVVPCHRVIKSNGEIGGYAFGVNKKIALLKAEGISVKEGKVVNYQDLLV